MQTQTIEHPHAAAVRGFRPLADLIPPHWQSGTVTAADGTPLHYIRTGTDTRKPPILLIHGVQVDGRMWLRTAAALETDYQVILPDLRGHGQSGDTGNGMSADLLTSDLITLMNALHLADPFLIGHSLGADIAGRVAAAYPVRGLVLVDPALRNFTASMPVADSDNPYPWMAAIFETMAKLSSLPHAERMVAGLTLLPPGSPLPAEADYVTFVEGHARFDPRLYRYLNTIGYLFEQPALLRQIACPVLLLTARLLPTMPGRTMPGSQPDTAPGLVALETHIRQLQHIPFPDSGHAIMFEQFERFVTTIQAFLSVH